MIAHTVGRDGSIRKLDRPPFDAAAMQRAVSLSAEPASQLPTAPANAQCAGVNELRQEIGRLGIVSVFGRLIQQVLGFSTVTCGTSIEQGDGEMVLRFLLLELRRVVRLDSLSIAPDGRGPIESRPDSVLKTVANFEPGATVVWTSSTSPPMKSVAEVAHF